MDEALEDDDKEEKPAATGETGSTLMDSMMN